MEASAACVVTDLEVEDEEGKEAYDMLGQCGQQLQERLQKID